MGYTKALGQKQRGFAIVGSLNGAGAVLNCNRNDLASEVYWELRPAAGEKMWVVRMVLRIEDDAGFEPNIYGGGSVLTNGIQIQQVRGTGSGATTLALYTDPDFPVKKNGDWGGYMYDIDYIDWGQGVTNKVLNGRYTLDKFTPKGVYLDGAANDALRLVIQDDFSGLVEHYFTFEGYYDNITAP